MDTEVCRIAIEANTAVVDFWLCSVFLLKLCRHIPKSLGQFTWQPLYSTNRVLRWKMSVLKHTGLTNSGVFGVELFGCVSVWIKRKYCFLIRDNSFVFIRIYRSSGSQLLPSSVVTAGFLSAYKLLTISGQLTTGILISWIVPNQKTIFSSHSKLSGWIPG